MEGYIILIVLLVVVALIGRVLWAIFMARVIIGTARRFQKEQTALLQMLQQAQQGPRGSGSGGNVDPRILTQFMRIQRTYDAMAASDQMRCAESMASMKAQAASMGCFLD